MSNDKMAEMLDAIGQHIAEIIDAPLENSYLNAQAGENWAEVGIFQDLGQQVLYHDPNTELSLQVIALWDAADPQKNGVPCITTSKTDALMRGSNMRMTGTRRKHLLIVSDAHCASDMRTNRLCTLSRALNSMN